MATLVLLSLLAAIECFKIDIRVVLTLVASFLTRCSFFLAATRANISDNFEFRQNSTSDRGVFYP